MKEFYSVSEYAKLVNKDPGNIRRMLIKGSLKGDKIGSQWVIPKDSPYPEDGRIKSGDYKNWRKMACINRDTPGLIKELKKMSKELSQIYGDSLRRIVLYGSYARGEQTGESDIDIAILLNDKVDAKVHDKVLDVLVDYELEMGLTLSTVPIEYFNYSQWKNSLPFYKNIDKEGIILWKAM